MESRNHEGPKWRVRDVRFMTAWNLTQATSSFNHSQQMSLNFELKNGPSRLEARVDIRLITDVRTRHLESLPRSITVGRREAPRRSLPITLFKVPIPEIKARRTLESSSVSMLRMMGRSDFIVSSFPQRSHKGVREVAKLRRT